MVLNEISLNVQDVIKKLLPEQKARALEKAGQIVENEAKMRCGVDTGVLRSSITHNTTENETTIGSNIEYAPYHHAKNRFLQEAIDENMDKIENCFKELLDG